MKFLMFLTGGALAVMAAANADAAVLLDQSDSTTSSSYSQLQVGQSFTAGLSGLLNTISLGSTSAYNVTYNKGISTVSVYVGGSVTPANLLASGSFEAILSSTDYSFDIASLGVQVVSGTQYLFRLSDSSSGSAVRYRGFYTNPSNYAGGDAVFGATATSAYDINFRTYVGESAVPEPASWAMMIGGFGLVGAALRRRRTVGILAA